jgi:hypothetical protein
MAKEPEPLSGGAYPRREGLLNTLSAALTYSLHRDDPTVQRGLWPMKVGSAQGRATAAFSILGSVRVRHGSELVSKAVALRPAFAVRGTELAGGTNAAACAVMAAAAELRPMTLHASRPGSNGDLIRRTNARFSGEWSVLNGSVYASEPGVRLPIVAQLI